MKPLGSAAIVAAIFVSTCSALATPKYVLHEKRDPVWSAPHSSIEKRSRMETRSVLPIRVGLSQRDLHLGYDWLMDVSHPESKNYGKHWTQEEVNKAFAPKAETVQAVRDWLISAGIESERISVSDNKGWLGFDATVEEAERLLNTQFYKHAHDEDNKYTVGCDEYYLPQHIQEHVDYITPGVKHQVYKRAEKRSPSTRSKGLVPIPAPPSPPGAIDSKTINYNCSYENVNQDCLHSLYNMPALNVNRKVPSTNSFGIFEAGRETYSQQDFDLYFANIAPYIPNGTTPIIVSVDGGVGIAPTNHSYVEPMIDFSIAYALTYPQPLQFWSTDDYYWAYYAYGWMDTLLDSMDGSFCTYSAFGQKGNNNTIDPIYPDPHQGGYKGPLQCGTYQPPKVLSISWTDYGLPMNYRERQCNEWMKLALQGMTAIASSGDHGVSAYPGAYGNADGCAADGSLFAPTFINECPYVLVVGGTRIKDGVSGYTKNSEMAVFQSYGAGSIPFTSGGGFSNLFARPSYQDQVVKEYFQVADPGWPYYSTTKEKNVGANGGVYNRAGRAFPDVSAIGAWTEIYVNSIEDRWGGTSLSAPIFASLVDLLNEARLNAGKSPVGWVHPVFYAHPEAFNDITEGFNQGCGHDIAFNASVGWDPVTGLGTPNFGKLKQIFLSLP